MEVKECHPEQVQKGELKKVRVKKILQEWKNLKHDPKKSVVFKDFIRKNIDITELVLFPTPRCNLNCKHCSYLCNSLEKDNLPLPKMRHIIDEAIDSGVKLFILVGKEPLADMERTDEIISYLNKKKAKFGIVSNGTLIEKHINKLKKHKFDYFDISIDGTEKFNDVTRGVGNFSRAKKGAELVIKNTLTDKFFISSVLMSYNYKNIPDMIKEFNGIGVKNFSLGVYVYTGHNPKDWILTKEQLVELIELLKKSESETDQIIIDIHTQVNHYWEYLIEKGVINEEEISIDPNNNVYFQIPNTNIFLKNSMFTTNFWNTAIITADGYFLDDYEYLASRDYKERSLGNINKESFMELLEKVKQKSPDRFLEKLGNTSNFMAGI